MFESLTHWFDSMQKESKLFDNPQDETLHSALASVLFHIMSADKKVVEKEKQKFVDILKHEFELNDEQIEHLYSTAKFSTADLHSDLHTVNRYLKKKPTLRMSFMKMLNQLMDIDGVQERELDIFYETLAEVFPEIKHK